MSKHYDENKVINMLAKQGIKTTWSYGTNCIILHKDRTIGIHTWGKIDYLTNHCGYHIIWKDSVISQEEDNPRNERKRRKDNSEMKHKKNFHKMNM